MFSAVLPIIKSAKLTNWHLGILTNSKLIKVKISKPRSWVHAYHHGHETKASISPDGKRVAFSAQYHGSTEIYTIPITGGRPIRHTFKGQRSRLRVWTASGKIIFSTLEYSGLPNYQLVLLNPKNNQKELAQADNGISDNRDKTLYFRKSDRFRCSLQAY